MKENEEYLWALIYSHFKVQKDSKEQEIKISIGTSTDYIEDDLCKKYKVGDIITIKPDFGNHEFEAKILKITYNFVYVTNRLNFTNYRLEKAIYSFDLEDQSEINKGDVVENVHISLIEK